MRKTVLFALALFAAVMMMSCSSDDGLTIRDETMIDETIIEPDNGFVSLENAIIEYGKMRMERNADTALSKETSDVIETRKGFFKKLWSFVKGVLTADAKGFNEGTSFGSRISGAVNASINHIVDAIVNNESKSTATALDVKKASAAMSSMALLNATDIALDSAVIFSHDASAGEIQAVQADSAGYYHNAVVIDVFNAIPDINTLTSMSDEERLAVINASVEQYLELEEGSLQEESLVTSTIGGDTQSDDYSSAPEFACVMSVIETYLESMYEAEGLEGDWVEYSKGVMSIIDDSDLEESSKEQMRSVFTIAFGSSRLWNKEMLEELIDEE